MSNQQGWLNRRNFLIGLAASPFMLSHEVLAVDNTNDWRKKLLDQRRVLNLYRPSTKERYNFCYWTPEGGYDKQAYLQGAWLLRDAEYKKQNFIDPELFNGLLVFLIQEWLRREGRPSDIHILSGYRTPEHNFRLEKAAKQSLHMQGKAADIHVPGVSTKLLAAMCMLLSAGGVGIYLDNGFIHVDTGKIRTWRG